MKKIVSSILISSIMLSSSLPSYVYADGKENNVSLINPLESSDLKSSVNFDSNESFELKEDQNEYNVELNEEELQLENTVKKPVNLKKVAATVFTPIVAICAGVYSRIKILNVKMDKIIKLLEGTLETKGSFTLLGDKIDKLSKAILGQELDIDTEETNKVIDSSVNENDTDENEVDVETFESQESNFIESAKEEGQTVTEANLTFNETETQPIEFVKEANEIVNMANKILNETKEEVERTSNNSKTDGMDELRGEFQTVCDVTNNFLNKLSDYVWITI